MNHIKLFVFLTILSALFVTQAYAKVHIQDHTTLLRNELSKISNPSLEQIKQLVLNNEERCRKEKLQIFCKDQKNQMKRVQAFENDDYSMWKQFYAQGFTDVPRDLQDVKKTLERYDVAVALIKKTASMMDRRLRQVFGKSLDLNLYITSALTLTNAKICRMEKDTKNICINLFVTAGLDTQKMQILLAHELYHLYEEHVLNVSIQASDLKHVANSKILQNIYSEGWATYASSVLVPNRNESDYLFQDVDVFDQHKKVIFKKILRHLNSNSNRVVARYVKMVEIKSGKLPPRSGYYTGFRLAQELAKTRGPDKVMTMNYLEFVAVAQTTLEQMVNNNPSNPSHPVQKS